MLKAIVVDDEQDAIESICTLLEEFCEGVEVIGTSQKPLEAIKLINKEKPELLFLDIEMPGASGFDVLDATSSVNYKVIFTTAYNHYAIQAIKYRAQDYLMKPVDIDELQEAVDNARVQIEQQWDQKEVRNDLIKLASTPNNAGDRIALCLSEGYYFVKYDEIYYLQSEGSYTRFFTKTGEHLVSKNLKSYEELLPDTMFLRVSNSHLVNTQSISSYLREDGGVLLLGNNDKIPISRSKKNDIKDRLGI